MNREERAMLNLDIERSIQLRKMLYEKLAGNGDVDLVEEWNAIEQLDLEIARKIRKRPIE